MKSMMEVQLKENYQKVMLHIQKKEATLAF